MLLVVYSWETVVIRIRESVDKNTRRRFVCAWFFLDVLPSPLPPGQVEPSHEQLGGSVVDLLVLLPQGE